jgi:hypothetical protein
VQQLLHPLAGRGGRRNVRVSGSPSNLSSQTSIRSSCRTDYSRPRLPRRSLCIPRTPRATLWGGIGRRHRRIGRWVVQTSRRSDTSWPLSQSTTTQSGKSLANSLAVEPVQTRTAASTSETLDRRCNRHCGGTPAIHPPPDPLHSAPLGAGYRPPRTPPTRQESTQRPLRVAQDRSSARGTVKDPPPALKIPRGRPFPRPQTK